MSKKFVTVICDPILRSDGVETSEIYGRMAVLYGDYHISQRKI
jgi:hypothetical protein